VLVRRAPVLRAAGDPLAVADSAGEAEEAVDLVVEEVDGADTKLRIQYKFSHSQR